MIATRHFASVHGATLMSAISCVVLLAYPALAQDTSKSLVIPQLGINVKSSPSRDVDGLLVCLSWATENGVPDARTGLSVGDVILNANGTRTKAYNPQALLNAAESAARSGKSLNLSFKKRTGPPVAPSAFVSPESLAAAQQYTYESKFTQVKVSADVMQELADKTAAERERNAKITAEQEAAKPKWHAYVPLKQFPLFAKECLGQLMRWNVCVSNSHFQPFADESKLFGGTPMFSMRASTHESWDLTSHLDYKYKKLTFVCNEPTMRAILAQMPEQGFLYFTCIDAVPYEYGTGYVAVVNGFNVGNHLLHPVDGKKHPQEQQ